MMEKSDKIRVWIDGCFDMVHFGHANAIRQAKLSGDQLFVGIHSDCKFHQYYSLFLAEILSRKNSLPIFNENERYKLVKSIKWVDQVVENVPYNTNLEIMDSYGCQICMHGDDIVLDENGEDVYKDIKDHGRYREFQRTEGVSTTDILQRILNAYKNLHNEGYTLDQSYSQFTSRINRSIPINTLDNMNTNKEQISSPYTNGGAKYYLSTMRITQFSGGPVKLEPKLSDVVVYCPGTFDLFHIGHVEFLEKASKLGDYLIVGLYNDDVSGIKYQRLRAVMRLEERMLSVLACKVS